MHNLHLSVSVGCCLLLVFFNVKPCNKKFCGISPASCLSFFNVKPWNMKFCGISSASCLFFFNVKPRNMKFSEISSASCFYFFKMWNQEIWNSVGYHLFLVFFKNVKPRNKKFCGISPASCLSFFNVKPWNMKLYNYVQKLLKAAIVSKGLYMLVTWNHINVWSSWNHHDCANNWLSSRKNCLKSYNCI